jgi:hypothetical protein
MEFDKRAIVATLRRELENEIAAMTRLARDAADAATHEENKPEGDKDMRSTEASYLARGQASRVLDLERAHALLGRMPVRAFEAADAIETSALVELSDGAKRSVYLLLGVAGGRRVKVGDVEVQTTTTSSPLGAALLGLAEGDEVEITTPQGLRTYEIVRVR